MLITTSPVRTYHSKDTVLTTVCRNLESPTTSIKQHCGNSLKVVNSKRSHQTRFCETVRDAKVRERLLRETKLTLTKTDEISRASESMLAQMKIVGDNSGATVYKKPQKTGAKLAAYSAAC